MSEEDAAGQSEWTRPGFIAALVVVVVIAAMGLTLLFVRGGDDSDGPASANPPASSAATDPEDSAGATGDPSDPAASLCGLAGLEESGSVALPAPEVTWELVGKMAAPTSAVSGPGVVEDDGFRYCYAHTREGALLAAANLGVIGRLPDLYYGKMNEHLVAAGPGRDLRESQPTPDATPGVSQVRGFQILSYGGDAASLALAIGLDDGRHFKFVYDLVWEDNDWRMTVLPDGDWPTQPEEIYDLSGFTTWSGA